MYNIELISGGGLLRLIQATRVPSMGEQIELKLNSPETSIYSVDNVRTVILHETVVLYKVYVSPF